MKIPFQKSKRLADLLSSKAFLCGLSLLLIAEIFYIFNIGLLLPLVIVGLYAVFLPMPGIFKSLLSRSVVGLLLFYAVYQLIAIAQFVVLPHGGFTTASVFLSLFSVALVLVIGRTKKIDKIFVTREDLYGILTALFLLVPMIGYGFAGGGIAERIASIGGIQGNDGATHFSILTESTVKERISYETDGIYYPYGFHLTTGFLEEAYGVDHLSFGWSGNVKLYMAEFMFFAAILAYILYFMVLGLLGAIKSGSLGSGSKLLAALALGPALTLFYLVPFLYNGFLNYYYICATLVAGLIMLLYEFTKPNELKSANKGAYAFIGLLLLFGASSSWPLFVPIVIMTVAIFAIVPNSRISDIRRIRPNKLLILLGMGFLIQLLPLYLQLSYATVSTSEGINAAGGLRIFHAQFILLAVVIMTYVYCSQRFSDSFKRATSGILLPLLVAVVGLAAYQYFYLGEIRYYAIKIAVFMEILMLVFLVALVVDRVNQIKLSWEQAVIVIVMVPATVFFALFSLNDNPVKDARNLLRSYSGQQKPAYLDQDVEKVTDIGLTGGLGYYNVVTLHYTDDQTKIFAHPQTAYWANTMTYRSASDNRYDEYFAKDCYYKIYMNLLVGTYTEPEQADLIKQTKTCAKIARDHGREFYVVTDPASASRMSDLFGADAVVKW